MSNNENIRSSPLLQFLLEQKNRHGETANQTYLTALFNDYQKYLSEHFFFTNGDQIEEVFADDTSNGIHIATLLTKLSQSNGLSCESITWVRRLAISMDYAYHLGRVFLSVENFAKAYQVKVDYVKHHLLDSGFLGMADNYFRGKLGILNFQCFPPFLMDSSDRIYFTSCFRIEARLARSIFFLLCEKKNLLSSQRVRKKLQAKIKSSLIPKLNLSEEISKFDWQIISSILAFKSRLLIISGGPGTGKTTTVAKIIFFILSLFPKISIGFCAPTGKAAKRLEYSLVKQIKQWPNEIQDCLYKNKKFEVLTVHRLLGIGASGIPSYNQGNVLHYDLVIVDEASMLDQLLACYLIEALSVKSRLILLGDKDQLSAIAPGSVFSDLSAISSITEETLIDLKYFFSLSKCELENIKKKEFFTLPSHNFLQSNPFKNDISEPLFIKFFDKKNYSKVKLKEDICNIVNKHKAYSLLKDSCIWLEKNYRFKKFSPIGEFAQAVKSGSFDLLVNCCQIIDINSSNTFYEKSQDQVRWYLDCQEVLNHRSVTDLIEGYCAYFDSLTQYLHGKAGIEDLFLELDQFRILCASREGKRGVSNINSIVVSYLGKVTKSIFVEKRNRIDKRMSIINHVRNFSSDKALLADSLTDVGVPIMITENHYDLELFNGDVGILLPEIFGDFSKEHSYSGKTVAFFPPFGNIATDAKYYDSHVDWKTKGHVNQKNISCATNNYRRFPLAIIPAYESAFAMTIHKSQGSEFKEVAVVFPEDDHENISRELLYTAVTRARHAVSIFCSRSTMSNVINRQSNRESGLLSRLEEYAEKWR